MADSSLGHAAHEEPLDSGLSMRRFFSSQRGYTDFSFMLRSSGPSIYCVTNRPKNPDLKAQRSPSFVLLVNWQISWKDWTQRVWIREPVAIWWTNGWRSYRSMGCSGNTSNEPSIQDLQKASRQEYSRPKVCFGISLFLFILTLSYSGRRNTALF